MKTGHRQETVYFKILRLFLVLTQGRRVIGLMVILEKFVPWQKPRT